jgi:hypothetical protein
MSSLLKKKHKANLMIKLKKQSLLRQQIGRMFSQITKQIIILIAKRLTLSEKDRSNSSPISSQLGITLISNQLPRSSLIWITCMIKNV